MAKKIMYGIIAACFLATLAWGAVQTRRLERSMAECGQYREQLELAENRESEVRAVINRTGLILGETTNSIGELRKKLEEVEDSYNSLWNMFYDDDSSVSDREE